MKLYYVYILGSLSGTLYTGITGSLDARTFQHKEKTFDGFTSKYGVDRLLYYEAYSDVRRAIAREKQIKRRRREKKVALIESMNPEWKDLAAEWYRSIPKVFAVRRDSSTRSPSPTKRLGRSRSE